QESLDLDPRGRHAAILLAHLSCFASASATATATAATAAAAAKNKDFPHNDRSPSREIAAPRSPPAPPPLPPQHWRPSDERTHELLRVLSLGVSSSRWDVCERGLEGRGGGGGGGGGESRGDYFGGGGNWRAFDEEAGGGVEVWVLLACAARARGDAGGAVSLFRRALALDENCLEAVYGIARVLQESGDHAASRELLLYLGERSQEVSKGVPSGGGGGGGGGGGARGPKLEMGVDPHASASR
ncbi:unnamed protein product, partial [Laminaria digitata]